MAIFTDYYKELNPEIKEYWKIISSTFPSFLIPYIETQTMQRLRKVGYFCAMDYGSKDVYNFKYYLSRLEHSISTALMVWHHTYDKTQTLAALFHDARTPATSHVVDYLNGDTIHQESTEVGLEETLKNDSHLLELLKSDNIELSDIYDYKKYPLVDNTRPKMCADRLDGIFLTSLVWTRTTTIEEISKMYTSTCIIQNESDELEFSFTGLEVANRIVELNEEIDDATNSNEDYYSMSLLASMERYLIDNDYMRYEDLFVLNDEDVIRLIETAAKNNELLQQQYHKWLTIKEIDTINKQPIKRRVIDPLISTVRYSHF